MWNLVFLEMWLTEQGYQVVNLGQCTPVDLVVKTAERIRPDVVVVSTVNGHGYLDAPELSRQLRQVPEIADALLVIGGKVGIEGDDNKVHFQALLDAGFDAVLDESNAVQGPNRLLELLAAPKPMVAAP